MCSKIKLRVLENKKTVVLQIIFIAGLIVLQSCSFYDYLQRKNVESKTKITDEAIKNSKQLQELDMVCTSVSLPENFKFVSKGGIDDQKVSLAYHYNSEIPFEEIHNIFRKHFIEKGWNEKNLANRYPKQIEFYNDHYKISLSYSSGNLSNYGVYCEKLK